MKRKSFQKLVALAIASTMAFSMAACGSSEEAANNAPAASSEAAPAASSEAAPAASSEDAAPAERQTLTFMTIDFNAGQCNVGDHAEEIMTKIEDYCNVDLEIEWVLTDVMEEKTTLALADPKTMPNIMTWSGTVNSTVVTAAKQGAFVDLGQYIWDSEKYPNLSQMIPSVADTLTIDGKLIAIPRTRVIGRNGLGYRADWAEKLGVTLPEKATPEDVYKMLYAFTYDDPDGNGADDTIGMEMTSYTGPFDIIQTWFGCGNGWAEVDGKLVPVHMQPEYMEAVDYIKKLYSEGLMPADWAARPTDSWSNGCKVGENGVYIDVLDGSKRIWKYYAAEETFTPSVVDPSVSATFKLHGAINDRTIATAGYNGFFTLSASTCDTPEKIEAALNLMEKLCDDEMRVLTGYGLEGIHYEIDAEGYLVPLDTENKALHADYAGLNQITSMLPNAEYTPQPSKKMDQFDQAQQDAYAAALPYAIVNPASAFLVNSPTYADLGSTLNEYVTQARTQYICGEIDLAGFQAAMDRWLSEGGQKIIDEVNEQYAANK